MSRSVSSLHARSFSSASSSSRHENNNPDDEEVELQWAAIERLPTSTRLRTSLFLDDKDDFGDKHNKKRVQVDVTKIQPADRRLFIDRIIARIEEDNRRLLWKLKQRMDKVGLEQPTVEVRYQNLCVEAQYEVVGGRTPLPTLWNTIKIAASAITSVARCKSEVNKIKILKNVSGIIKPSRMTLLLGPPGCGKTTFLQALAGKLDPSLKATGEISYNGYMLNEFVPQKTSAYVSQYDQHIAEMTVRETLDFSARCQGVGDREDMLQEVIRREKRVGIVPEPDIDTYMKAISVGGQKQSLQTDYILKILGMDNCADTMVGDAMRRGISGGQKKRLTSGEMMIGPTRALFMDEISNGLDSSTTFQIVTCLQQLAHITESTIVISLLQPAPETFDLFEDLILMAEGKVVYHGPREDVIPFFETCGFKCPARKGVADFLQEVFSKKDQPQYWYRDDQPYSYVSVNELVTMFEQSQVGKKLRKELSEPFEKSEAHRKALSFNIYTLSKWELLKVCLAREWLLMKRNSFIHVFKSVQLIFVAMIAMTMFIRTRMEIDALHSTLYMGSLFFALMRLMTNGLAELSLTIQRMGVFYKQRDFHFYPAWAYSIPSVILKIPFSLLDASLWTALTYYVIGYSPEPGRFFYQLFLLFLIHQVSISLFRLIAATVRTPPIAANVAVMSVLIMCLFSGFIVRKDSMPDWLKWGFWLSPLSYAEIGGSLNEFHAPRWQKASNVTLGHQVLQKRGLEFSNYFLWISLAALVGFWVLLNLGFTFALTYNKSPGRSPRIVSDEELSEQSKDSKDVMAGKQMLAVGTSNDVIEAERLKMALPFQPLAITFEKIQYYVDTPQMLKKQGFPHDKLHLLQDITGAFRPGVLTALMGVSGAGKTTLMDVLSGRKTGGYIEGEIKVGGYPKVQKTYARVSGYCEQSDIHSPHVTVEESVIYSAWLRLSAQVDTKTRYEFVEEVIEMIELDKIKDALVGMPGAGGISIEQRKRLTIAVELVANPSIIFMDEPTTGLDARSAAIVMRAVKNIVKTNRTIVCTIHQPSIDVFESFDELILMKRGGQVIYSGELGQNSNKLIEYLEAIPGVPKIKDNYNPATWMLEVTSPSSGLQLGVDFVQIYRSSSLCMRNEELIRRLSIPKEGSNDLHFGTRFPQTGWEQFKACLWKRHLSYWRSPTYNFGRLVFLTASSVIFAALLWQRGQKIDGEQDFFNVIGSMFIFVQLMGISNCSSIIPFVSTEREVVYRERFAGMYSSLAYSIAQLLIEIPYILLQAAVFCAITYPSVDFYPSAYKVLWYYYTIFCTLLTFNYLGLMITSLTPSFQLAGVSASVCYTVFNLFSGYLIPEPKMPRWWAWAYWICPNSWSLKAILTSQYGDVDKAITLFGQSTSIRDFLGSYYGYKHGDLRLIAVILLLFPLLFATVFAAAIAKLNFQRR